MPVWLAALLMTICALTGMGLATLLVLRDELVAAVAILLVAVVWLPLLLAP